MSGSAIEYIRGLSIVKSFGQEGASIESFRKANTDLKNIHIKVEKGYTPFNCLHLFSLKLASIQTFRAYGVGGMKNKTVINAIGFYLCRMGI